MAETRGQLPLGAGTASRRRGVVERAAAQDLTMLRQLELLPPGSRALERALLQVARELDRAEVERDRYGTINASRELLRLRLALSPVAGGERDHDPDEFVRELAARAAETRDGAQP